jgi:hypothetical protein
VLQDIHERGADLIVNLGDILSGPLQCAETADRLMPLRLPTISCNHERQLLTFEFEQMRVSDRFAASVLGPDHRAWISTLPETLRLDDVLMVHGSPRSDLECFLETVTESGMRNASVASFAYKVETGSPHARYAMLESSRGPWSANLLAVGYDWDSAALLAQMRGRTAWGRALRTGRV